MAFLESRNIFFRFWEFKGCVPVNMQDLFVVQRSHHQTGHHSAVFSTAKRNIHFGSLIFCGDIPNILSCLTQQEVIPHFICLNKLLCEGIESNGIVLRSVFVQFGSDFICIQILYLGCGKSDFLSVSIIVISRSVPDRTVFVFERATQNNLKQ